MDGGRQRGGTGKKTRSSTRQQKHREEVIRSAAPSIARDHVRRAHGASRLISTSVLTMAVSSVCAPLQSRLEYQCPAVSEMLECCVYLTLGKRAKQARYWRAYSVPLLPVSAYHPTRRNASPAKHEARSPSCTSPLQQPGIRPAGGFGFTGSGHVGNQLQSIGLRIFLWRPDIDNASALAGVD